MVLKNSDLISFFNGDILTKEIAEKKGVLEIQITGGITEDLVEDIEEIGRELPGVFKKIRIVNSSTLPGNMQRAIDLIGRNIWGRIPEESRKLEDIVIASRCTEDFSCDIRGLKCGRIKRLSLKNNNDGRIHASHDMIYGNVDLKELHLEGFDLYTLDLARCPSVQTLSLKGDKNINFRGIRGLEHIIKLSADDMRSEDEVREIINFISHSPELAHVDLRNIDLSSYDIFEIIRNANLLKVNLHDNNIGLDGIEKLDDADLAQLTITNNNVKKDDIPKIVRFIQKHPLAEFSFGIYNYGLHNELNAIRPNGEYSSKTQGNIRDYFSSVTYKRNQSSILTTLLDNPLIPYSINDAPYVRGAGIVLNPIELDDDTDIATFDFEQEHLKGATLLLTVQQAERLAQLGKKIPMKIGIEIEKAADLSVEKLDELVKKIGVSEVRMIGKDLEPNQRVPYMAAEYRRARNILDEVVSGIDPSESDLDKFTTIYTRLSHMPYDMSAASGGELSREGIKSERDKINSSRNMVGGLLSKDHSCVCAGYAEILRNALSMVGIKARYICGRTDPNVSSRHAWTEVELTGEDGAKHWYLADLTWDRLEAQPANAKYKYPNMLLKEDKFRERHKAPETTYMTTRHGTFSREVIDRSLQKAIQRDIDITRKHEDDHTEPKPNPQPAPIKKPVPKGIPNNIQSILDDLQKNISSLEREYEESMRRNPDTQGYLDPLPYRPRTRYQDDEGR